MAGGDPRVSGVHLELRREGERLLIRDVGSANGTWLGPHRVSELELALGGELIVGDTVLRLELETEAVPAPQSKNDGFGTLVGTSPIMREIFSLLERVSQKNLSVLVQGATGTGKEELARSVHAASDRARGQAARKVYRCRNTHAKFGAQRCEAPDVMGRCIRCGICAAHWQASRSQLEPDAGLDTTSRAKSSALTCTLIVACSCWPQR